MCLKKLEKVKLNKSHRKLLAVGVVLLTLGVVLVNISPLEIVKSLGVQNSLIVAGLVSVLGGVSTFTSASFYAVIGAMALGGVPVGALVLVCGPALLLGDLAFYYFGLQIHDSVPQKYLGLFNKLSNWIEKGHDWWVQVLIIFYTGITPFPGDILMIGLAMSSFPFRKMWLPLLLGNMILVAVIAGVSIGGAGFLANLPWFN